MLSADEILKKYNVSLEKRPTLDADSILAKYGVSVEEPSPFKAEFAPVEPVTTAVAPEAPMELDVIPPKIEELPERKELRPIDYVKMAGMAAAFPPWTGFVMKQARRPQKGVIAMLKAFQEPPEVVSEERKAEYFRRYGKHLFAEFGKGFALKTKVTGLDIVKNMLPEKARENLENPDWLLKHPAKHMAYEWSGAFYEAFTDPFIWWLMIRGNQVALNQRIGRVASQKLMNEVVKIWKVTGKEYEYSKNLGVIYDKKGLPQGITKMGQKIFSTPQEMDKFLISQGMDRTNILGYAQKGQRFIVQYPTKTAPLDTPIKMYKHLSKWFSRTFAKQPRSYLETRRTLNELTRALKEVETIKRSPDVARGLVELPYFGEMPTPAMRAEIVPAEVTKPVIPTVEKVVKPTVPPIVKEIKKPVVAEPIKEEIAKLEKTYPELAKMAEKEAIRRAELAAKEPLPEVKVGKEYEKELKVVEEKLKGKDYTPEKFEKATEIREEISKPRKALIHILGRKKGLIYKSEKTGKLMRGRFNKILKNYSAQGVISVNKLMNNADADHIIEMINMFPDWREGMRRPVIPITKKIVTKEWFDTWNKTLLKKKEPTPITYLTPQWYTALKLGFGKIVKPIWEGKLSVTHYHRQLSKELDTIGKGINKMYGATVKERMLAFKRNIPTKAYQRMAKLLDTYEEAPEALSGKEKKIFNYFRDKTKDYIEQENAIRKQLKLKPIKYRKAYLRHVATEMGSEMLNGRYPIPENVKYYMKDVIGKKVWNPTEFSRKLGKLSDDVYKIFSRDPIYAMKSLSWHALKEIHLSVPLHYMRETLNVLGDKVPARAKSWFIRYVNETVKGQMPDFDAGVNKLLRDSGVEGFLNFFLKKFGRTLGYNPIKTINSKFSRLVHISLLSAVPRLIVRNVFQLVQDMALYPIRDIVQAYIGLAPEEVKQWAKDSMFLKTYSGFELIPKDAWSALPRLGLLPYQASALFNARKGYLVAGTAAYRLYQNPSWKAKGWTLNRVKEEAEFGAKLTQYWYHLMGMPQVFRLKALAPFTILQSWWMNHIFGLEREVVTKIFTGKTYDNVEIPLSWRIGLLRYAILGVPFLVWMGYKRSTILGVLPSNMAPMAEFMFGFYAYIVGSAMGGDRGDAMKEKGKRKMLYSYKALIPYSNAWRNFMKQWHGAPWKDIFIYPKEKAEEGETSLEREKRRRLK